MYRNAILTIGAQALGILVALASIPIIVHHLGNDQFGLLTILWAFVGYFSVFDFGSGVGLLKFLPECIVKGETRRGITVVRCSLLAGFTIGVVAAVITIGIAFFGVQRILTVPAAIEEEAQKVLIVLAFGLPAVLVQISLRGVVMSYNRYDVLNAIQAASGVIQWGGASVAVVAGGGLLSVVIITVASRYLALGSYLYFVLRMVPGIVRERGTAYRPVLREFLKFGGWASVPQLVAPLMTLLERAIIGGVLTLAVVPYFSIPNEVVSRALIIPVGVVSAVLPVLSGSWALSETRQRALRIYRQSLRIVGLVMLPLCLVFGTFSHDILRLWIGEEFAGNAASLLAILSAGLIFNSLSQLPNALLLAIGRPELPGKLQIVELPLYVAALLILTRSLGVIGTAIAWALRVTLEFMAFVYLTRRSVGETQIMGRNNHERLGLAGAGTALLAIVAVKLLVPSTPIQILSALTGLLVYVSFAWTFVLDGDERNGLTLNAMFKKQLASDDSRS